MEYKNIIFLDIDGVLNCELHYRSQQFTDHKQAKKYLKKAAQKEEIDWKEYYNCQLSRERIEWLNELCKETDSVVVISSTWRMGQTMEQLQETLGNAGATFTIVGTTPYDNCRIRGVEIFQWLEKNITKETHGIHAYQFHNYVIIDDDSDMLLRQREHFFQTDSYSGLTPNTCYSIKLFLNKLK